VQLDWTWAKDKILGGVIAAIILAILAFVINLINFSPRMGYLEEQAKKIPEINSTVSELKANQENFKKINEDAARNVKDFNESLRTFGRESGELKVTVDNLKGLNTDIRDLRTDFSGLRKAVEDLRVSVVQLSEEMKKSSDQTHQTTYLVSLSKINLRKREQYRHLTFEINVPSQLGEIDKILQLRFLNIPGRIDDIWFEYDYIDKFRYIIITLHGGIWSVNSFLDSGGILQAELALRVRR
jgi:hypothetical protein